MKIGIALVKIVLGEKDQSGSTTVICTIHYLLSR